MDPVSVSALTTHIVALFQSDDLLRDVTVFGEVSNWNRAASGHAYFSMKDDTSAVNAVMWRNSVASQSWLPKSGDQILAHGYVDVYPDRGVYQLYVSRIQPAGKGQLYAQFEALKRKLLQEGLFDEEGKRPLPERVQRIGVVTSSDAAALRDICRVLDSRWPMVEVVIFPTMVQGADAPTQIAAAIGNTFEYSQHSAPLDVLIVARGGGSMEDLWAFNDEGVAYAIAGCPIPVVTGIGHETDFTIADFVADVRSPTPSAAAAIVVPDQQEVQAQLLGAIAYMSSAVRTGLNQRRQEIATQLHRLQRTHPRRLVDTRRQALDDRERRLNSTMLNTLTQHRIRSRSAEQQLAMLNPQNVLRRGYSIITNSKDRVVSSPAQVQADESLRVQAFGGAYSVRVQHDGRKE